MRLVPVDYARATAFVERFHRTHPKATVHKFSVGIEDRNGRLLGVAMASRPRRDDRFTLEVARCCTDGSKNACSMLYGAVCRAAQALGYRRVVTYTQTPEMGHSLKAAGFKLDRELSDAQTTDGRSRKRWVRNVG